MQQTEMVERIYQRPFQPFRLHMKDGRTYELRTPELVRVLETKILIFFPDKYKPPPAFDHYETAALQEIILVEPIALPAASQPA